MTGSDGRDEPSTPSEPDAHGFDALDGAIDRSLASWKTNDVPICVLFSGGVDSGVLAWELRRNRALSLVTVGTPAGTDLEAARVAAPRIGAHWIGAEVSTAEIAEVAHRIDRTFGPLPRTSRSVLVAFSLALAHAPDRVVLCGQGADELFLGYRHFHGLTAEAAAARATSDLRVLREVDWPRAQAVARSLDRAVVAPFLAEEFIAAALAIPIEQRLPADEPKRWFRDWAARRGLPTDLARRPKRALQFGSGVDRVLRRMPPAGSP